MRGVVNPDTLDLAALIRHLPQASSLDLYRLQYVIEALLNEPRRILEIRQRLRAGMTVRFFSFHEAAFLTGRITALGTRAVTLEEIDRRLRHTGVPLCRARLAVRAALRTRRLRDGQTVRTDQTQGTRSRRFQDRR